MKFALKINVSPYQHQALDSAYCFAKAAVTKGHYISRVFLYNDGVYQANLLAIPPQDERHLYQLWQALKNPDGSVIDKVVCVASGLRRGMIDADTASKNSKNQYSVATGFRVAGLGQLIEASILADRVVTFGG